MSRGNALDASGNRVSSPCPGTSFISVDDFENGLSGCKIGMNGSVLEF